MGFVPVCAPGKQKTVCPAPRPFLFVTDNRARGPQNQGGISMEYRILPHGGEAIGVIGMGSSSLGQAGPKEARATVALALEKGVNYFDLAAGDTEPFAACGDTVGGARKKVFYQVHFGADYSTGKYGWTLNAETIKRSVAWQLETLKTDYVDFGFIHCLDEAADWDAYRADGAMDYLLALKHQGVVRHIGLSSHTPAVARQVLDTGLLDMLMFSVNPAYDYRTGGEFAIGSADERWQLYRRCQALGVGITVMKPFCGGQLLDAATSPFGKALTEYQCIRYALERPGVVTVLPGVRNRADLQRVLGYFDANEAETDYGMLGAYTPAEASGRCVYCNHCQPCPAGLDVGLINKYYDLALAGDALAADHYDHLGKTAGDCIACGHCDSRCPFGVAQSTRMEEIAAYFGR